MQAHTSSRSLGRQVADHNPVRCARETSISDQRDVLSEASADECGTRAEHFRHAGGSTWSLVADDQGGALVDLALDNRLCVFMYVRVRGQRHIHEERFSCSLCVSCVGE